MSLLSYIIWNADPEIFTIPIFDRPVRWYGLLFALGFLVSQQIMFYIYRTERKPEKDVETLTVFMVIATILGARLGHVFFYEPDKYLSNPIDILKIWEGGLASHGAAFGILFALWLYTRYDVNWKLQFKRVTRPGQNYFQVVDRIVIVVAITGCLIRFGNFMNSEIYGVPTNSDYGVVYARNMSEYLTRANRPIEEISYEQDKSREIAENGSSPVIIKAAFKNIPDQLNEATISTYLGNSFKSVLRQSEHFEPGEGPLEYELSKNENGAFTAEVKTFAVPRHPTQLYESMTSLLIGVLLFIIWVKMKNRTPSGLLLGLFLILLFGLRFVHEIFKENQVSFEDELTFNMGQILSIPLIIAGVVIFVRALTIKEDHEAI
ncbi:MAG: prolipoprotein diacylglyceryl transferase [Bacteroidota bacterium]